MRWSRLLIVLPYAAALVAFALVPAASKAQPPATTRPADLARTLPPGQDKHLAELAIDGVGLNTVFEVLRGVSGANIFVDWKALESMGIDRNAPIALKERNTSLSKLLDKVLFLVSSPQVKLSWGLEDGVIVVSNPEMVDHLIKVGARRTERRRSVKGFNPLQTIIFTTRFDGAGFLDVLDFLAETGKVKIDVDWKTLNAAHLDRNAPVDLSFGATSLEHVLDLLLFDVGGHLVSLQYTVQDDGHIFITTAASNGK